MPEIFRFHGIKIYVYYKDHSPPHLHANYGGEWSSLVIADGALMPGRNTLNRPAVAVVRKWIREHREAIMLAWDRALHGLPPGKINGKKRRSYRKATRHGGGKS